MIKYNAKIGIYSTKFSADEISNILGIRYDVSWVKDAPRSARSSTIKFEQHGWFLLSNLASEEPLNAHITQLLERFKPYKEQLTKISDDCVVYMNCDIEGDENPELFFDEKNIKELAEIQASLDIDAFIGN